MPLQLRVGMIYVKKSCVLLLEFFDDAKKASMSSRR